MCWRPVVRLIEVEGMTPLERKLAETAHIAKMPLRQAAEELADMIWHEYWELFAPRSFIMKPMVRLTLFTPHRPDYELIADQMRRILAKTIPHPFYNVSVDAYAQLTQVGTREVQYLRFCVDVQPAHDDYRHLARVMVVTGAARR